MSNRGSHFTPGGLLVFDTSTFSGSYQKIGTPMANATRVVKFSNTSTVGVTISFDGINDHEFIPAATGFVIDCTTNRDATAEQLVIVAQTQFYIKGSAGTGNFYLSTYYAN